ncbi:uncharacterized protein VDAG_03068 [Verticillium dahliae VdLs.17]|uniref:Uncharacterized protein n=1 Tax=Verticillium dahliae (strain VdLs.17 / ATCC MYA-4575 / FGSC 10137) TaxID=498257 RepID=G2X045_VERDV|nr:uncharacterized protein VDAG_03068 [Verticillium dahliae VdLs.17]EGY21628.1 hypothetical protein VDAG_03068 [Verticillium dahliae VdLs.17]KAF3344963.1 hypothetical protein VdG2_07149 [Verticillium dahliae VDG2]
MTAKYSYQVVKLSMREVSEVFFRAPLKPKTTRHKKCEQREREPGGADLLEQSRRPDPTPAACVVTGAVSFLRTCLWLEGVGSTSVGEADDGPAYVPGNAELVVTVGRLGRRGSRGGGGGGSLG